MQALKVTAPECDCEFCGEANSATEEDKANFDWESVQKDFKFPVFYNPKGKGGVPYYVDLVKILETEQKSLEDLEDLVSFLTYFHVDGDHLNLHEYLTVAELLCAQDLEPVIKKRRLAVDFLSKISRLFVVAWYAVTVHLNKTAIWAACVLRRLLIHIIQFPVISSEVAFVCFTVEKWPVMGPVQIIERLAKDHLTCTDTISLLTNLTRISNVSNLLAQETRCVEVIQEQFIKCCGYIQKHDDRGGLLLMLFMNLALNDEFLEFLIKKNDSYFMTVVLLDFIKQSVDDENTGVTIWLFLRNVSMKIEGLMVISQNLETYLGHILYPIAGPEKLTEDENQSVPYEVCYMLSIKTRVADRTVRACIVDILYQLCKFKKDRIQLRGYKVYAILKHYHLAEEDEALKEKIEDLVNILIRKDDTDDGSYDLIKRSLPSVFVEFGPSFNVIS